MQWTILANSTKYSPVCIFLSFFSWDCPLLNQISFVSNKDDNCKPEQIVQHLLCTIPMNPHEIVGWSQKHQHMHTYISTGILVKFWHPMLSFLEGLCTCDVINHCSCWCTTVVKWSKRSISLLSRCVPRKSPNKRHLLIAKQETKPLKRFKLKFLRGSPNFKFDRGAVG